MISIEDKPLTIIVRDDDFEFEKIPVLDDLLAALDYPMEVDFRVSFTSGEIIGYQGDITPKEKVDIIKALEELRDAFENIDELDKRKDKTTISFELLLLKDA